jgi:hypothetical protein
MREAASYSIDRQVVDDPPGHASIVDPQLVTIAADIRHRP